MILEWINQDSDTMLTFIHKIDKKENGREKGKFNVIVWFNSMIQEKIMGYVYSPRHKVTIELVIGVTNFWYKITNILIIALKISHLYK